MSAPTWNDITSAPSWDGLQPEQRDAVRQRFFSDFVAPHIPDDADPDAVQKIFMDRTADSMTPRRSVGYLESAYRGAAGGLSATDQFARKLELSTMPRGSSRAERDRYR